MEYRSFNKSPHELVKPSDDGQADNTRNEPTSPLLGMLTEISLGFKWYNYDLWIIALLMNELWNGQLWTKHFSTIKYDESLPDTGTNAHLVNYPNQNLLRFINSTWV